MKLENNKVGLALGGLLALWHVFWLVLVAMGTGQWFLGFIYDVHHLNNPFVVQSFNLLKGAILVGVAFVFGYILGWIYAWFWNSTHKK